MKRIAFAAFIILVVPLFAQEKKDHLMLSSADLSWTAGPPSLPKGAQVVVLEGNPGDEGIFTMRLKVPPNYRIPAHWHPAFEHVTVLEGVFSMGRGEKFDEAALHDLRVGSFAMMAPGTRHFAASKDGAVIQLHGMGPWQIYYVKAEDDPRWQASRPAPSQ